MINFFKSIFISFIILLCFVNSFAFKEDHLINLINNNECTNCDLSGANLSNLKFENTNLSGSNLKNAILEYSSLYNVNLSNANLSNASLIELE